MLIKSGLEFVDCQVPGNGSHPSGSFMVKTRVCSGVSSCYIIILVLSNDLDSFRELCFSLHFVQLGSDCKIYLICLWAEFNFE